MGSTLVQRLAERDYADVVMFDIVPNMPQGKALDMLQAGPVLGYDSLITGTNDYIDTANSDIVVITSGFPRKPGMSRDDLVKKKSGNYWAGHRAGGKSLAELSDHYGDQSA